jgi:DNA replication protein DnaC
MNAAKNYVANFNEFRKSGKGLLLFGTVGTGKTYAAACIANALIDKGYPVLMTNFARIANTVSGMWEGKQEYYDSLNRFPLLILDDLATERKTEYMQEIVFAVTDARYRAGLPLIVTTNLTSEELKHPSDISYQRTFSRLLEMCLPVRVEGKDKRLEKLKEDIQPMKDLLGL